MAANTLDQLNGAILAALQENPSRTNKDIGQTLGVSEPTIAARIRAMEDAHVMRIMMQRDIRAMGDPVLALVHINVQGRLAEDVAADLAQIPECVSVSVGMSNPDIFINMNAPDAASLQRIVDEKIAQIAGIGSYEVNIALEVVKLDPRYGRLKPR